MLPGKDLYHMIENVLERGINSDATIDSVRKGEHKFLAQGIVNNISTNDSEFILFTKNFVIIVERYFEMDGLSKEYGTWRKDYHAYEATEKYYYTPKRISTREVLDWISKNSIEFI